MLAVIHAAHAHISVSQKRRRIHLRNRGEPLDIRAQGSPRIAGSVDSLGKNCVRAVGIGLDNHVICFCNADSKFIHRHRFDVLPVGGDYGHLQARNAQVENSHCRAIYKAQANFFTTIEQAEPPVFGSNTIH